MRFTHSGRRQAGNGFSSMKDHQGERHYPRERDEKRASVMT
jgi:hypothetical protein